MEEAIFSGHFGHVLRPPTLAGVALMSAVLALRRDGHVVLPWSDFAAAAAAHDRQLLDNASVVDAETALLHTVVRTSPWCTRAALQRCQLVVCHLQLTGLALIRNRNRFITRKLSSYTVRESSFLIRYQT